MNEAILFLDANNPVRFFLKDEYVFPAYWALLALLYLVCFVWGFRVGFREVVESTRHGTVERLDSDEWCMAIMFGSLVGLVGLVLVPVLILGPYVLIVSKTILLKTLLRGIK